ncbi:MAG: PQQ-binding-like beta-propeller repeat protein [Phycisphaerales bacterium]|nr:PQQ-binding-like beta-propeller repeat protein [Phycisphaerales bacterium]
MRKALLVSFWLAVGLPAALAQQDFIPSDGLHGLGLVKYWQLQLPLEPGQRVTQGFLVDDHLYIGTNDGYVFSVHAQTGLLRWLRPITRAGYDHRRPAHVGDRVVFATPFEFQLYEKVSGQPLARRDLGFAGSTGVAAYGDRLFYVGGLDRKLYAFDSQTLLMRWRALVEDSITSTPAVFGDQVFFANDAGRIYAGGAVDKTARWSGPASTLSSVVAPLVAREEGVYVASRDFSLYLFDPNFGRLRWRARLAGPLEEAPVVPTFSRATPPVERVLFQFTSADGLAAIEGETIAVVEDRVRWRLPEARYALTVHRDQLFALSGDERLLRANLSDGILSGSVPVPGFRFGLPAADAQTLFLASPDGRLFCARPRGLPPLSQEDLLTALGTEARQTDRMLEPPPAPPAQPPALGTDPFETTRTGTPVGGRSRVSREFRGPAGN